MRGSIQVGRIGGVPLQFHWTFLFVFLWVAYMSNDPIYGFRTDTLVRIGGWVLLLFSCVLLHELGHALIANRLGIGTKRILLFPLGGGAFLERMPTNPREELLIASGGPIVNILLALLCAPLIWWLSPDGDRLALLRYLISPSSNVAIYQVTLLDYAIVLFFLMNLMLALFNLLPAYPLDGGRMLRAGLTWPLGRRRATAVAAVLGVLAAAAFAYVALELRDWLLGIGGILVGAFAGFELLVNRREQLLSSRLVTDYYEELHPPVYADDYLSRAQQVADTARVDQLLVFDEWHQMVGVLEAEQLNNDTQAAQQRLDTLMRRDWYPLHPKDTLLTAAKAAVKEDYELFPVYQGNQLVGILDIQRVYALVSYRHRRQLRRRSGD